MGGRRIGGAGLDQRAHVVDRDDPRLGREVGEQYAGHQRRIDAVVAGPLLPVWLQQLDRHRAQRGLPRSAVAAFVADHQVRRLHVVLAAGVDLAAVEHAADDRRAAVRIGPPGQAIDQLALQRPDLLDLDDTLRFAPGAVDEQSIQTQRIGT